MKFGKKLRFRAVFVWLSHYLNYKRLKQEANRCGTLIAARRRLGGASAVSCSRQSFRNARE